eukprot:scaffold10522_cov62-Phaeocystis_antarctica.AAC.5
MGLMFFGTRAFNQPLSLDTSSVTDMSYMFWVRSFPCPAPNLQSGPPLHTACNAVARRLPPPSPQLAPHLLCPPFDSEDSAGRVGVQPATKPRYLQRHRHELHVLRALLPVPFPAFLQTIPPLHAACTAVARRLPRPSRQLAPHRMPSVRLSAERVGVQPAAELRHVQRQTNGPHVLRRAGVQPATELRHLQRHNHVQHVLLRVGVRPAAEL